MGKNKRKTILDQFKSIKKRSNKNIIEFLIKQNELILISLGLTGELSEETKEEIADFFEFFVEKEYFEKTENARYEIWGEDDAPIMRLGAEYAFPRKIEEKKKQIENLEFELSESAVDKANYLLNNLWNIKKIKEIGFISEEYCQIINREEEIPEEMIEAEKERLYLALLSAFASKDTVWCIVSCFVKEKECDVFMLTLENEDWKIVPSEFAKTHRIVAPNPGVKVNYVHISKYMKVLI